MTLLPEGVGALAALLVIAASFIGAFVTAAFGLGGGLFLLAVMGAAFPALSIVPVHGVAQLGANASRFGFLARHAVWPSIAWFATGAVIGAALGARLYVAVPPWILKLAIAGFILIALFAPKLRGFNPSPAVFGGAGAVSSVLTMFVGATGPFVAGVLTTSAYNRLQLVSTHAAMMAAQHGLKTLAFGALGFAFAEWAFIITGIVLAGFAGSWLGARRLAKTTEGQFQQIFKMILTGLALYLMVSGILDALAIPRGQAEAG
ncbi:MAG: TSUP family transporter [Pseudomonadota bacterium]